MANLFQKREISKSDLNFFEEYAVASKRMANLYRWGVLGAIAIIGIVVAYIVVLLVSLGVKKAEIKAYEVKFDTPEYKELRSQAEQLSATLENKSEYYYTLSSMRRDVDARDGVDPAILTLVEENVPSDTIITSIELTGSEMILGGDTFSYYSPTEMYHLINSSDTFINDPLITITRADVEDGSDPAVLANTFLNAHYAFNLNTIINGRSLVSVSSIANNGNAIGNVFVANTGDITMAGVHTLELDNGEIITLGDNEHSIANVTYNGVEYTLSSVLINGQALSTADLTSITQSGTLSRTITGDVEIELHYSVVEETTGEEEA